MNAIRKTSIILAVAVLSIFGTSQVDAAEPEGNECGATSLYALLRLHGKTVTHDEVRIALPAHEHGSSLDELKKCAENYGLVLDMVKCNTPLALHSLRLPAILHVEADRGIGHYLVAVSFNDSGERLRFIDGTDELDQSIKTGELLRDWTGYALVVRKSPAQRVLGPGSWGILWLLLSVSLAVVLSRTSFIGVIWLGSRAANVPARTWTVVCCGLLGLSTVFIIFMVRNLTPEGTAPPSIIQASSVPPVRVMPQQLTKKEAAQSIQSDTAPLGSSHQHGIGAVPLDVLERTVARVTFNAPFEDQKVHALIHALRLWGATDEIPDRSCVSGPKMLSALLNHDSFSEMFPGSNQLLFNSSFGLGVRVGIDREMIRHTDGYLSILGEVGIPTQTVIDLGDETNTVADVLQESIMRFQLDQYELEWTAVAYASYLPPVNSWTNRFGEKYSFDQLAEKLLDSRDGAGTCYGTHAIYSLCYLVRVDEEQTILSKGVRDRIIRRLKQIATILEKSQYFTGCWENNWYVEPPIDRNESGHPPVAPKILIRSTGHHLEWMAIAPADVRPADACIRSACRFVANEILALPQTKLQEAFCPATHAVRALCLHHNVEPAELIRLNTTSRIREH